MDEVKKKQLKRYFSGVMIYKFDNDKLLLNRIEKYVDDEDIFRVRTQENKSEYIKSDDVINEWILLNPDAIITFNIVSLEKGKDVIVCLHSSKSSDPVPDVICRQSIIDVFSDMAYKMSNHYKFTLEEIMFVGMSISKETCPAEIDYNVLLACNSVDSSFKVAYYLTDTLDDILSFVLNKSKFDKILKTIERNGLSLNTGNVSGYCSSLKELMIQTKFMFEVCKFFKIKEFPFVIKEGIYDHRDTIVNEFEKVMGICVNIIYIMKYDKSIDLSSLKREYVLGRTVGTKDLYVIGYDSIG